MRRSLTLNSLDDAIEEAERLLRIGYTKTKNWSLAQICCHLRLSIECNMDGYPRWMMLLGYPLRPFLRWLALPRVLAGDSPSGIRTAGMFVPPDNLDDSRELEKLRQCVQRFQNSNQPMHAHPGFGSMSNEEFDHFHAAHAAHHLSFLQLTENAD